MTNNNLEAIIQQATMMVRRTSEVDRSNTLATIRGEENGRSLRAMRMWELQDSEYDQKRRGSTWEEYLVSDEDVVGDLLSRNSKYDKRGEA
ncbi:hypothetical protein GOP47_0024395 [Adiantum capillus-veneris]|uniref:Uncharacterized protein n=1 Tax=Adiantum capillus-veneris TaxID=13818 RepID=A0A9D4U237_ADICA|nr:hypothetical protein GOP47_0024395 [Adiantum capillus-veneris]